MDNLTEVEKRSVIKKLAISLLLLIVILIVGIVFVVS